ncbi:MAG TPA: putative sulfate exporter family transporter [Edaphobacter sp.]|uniref:YeiH family protein n=1 Tax=Edaphobacter sp. TaxID=1934404 RepID=UPI002C456E4D|nr:putative sulfate exporter family transporter [Edaphobacter sp.]HUZ94639.1 putative sulfate exporter family transporter [Edaphobacter sp.]
MSAHTLPNPTAGPAPSPASRFAATVPGMALLFGVGLLGKVFEHTIAVLHAQHPAWPLPHIEYVLWAIILGLVISNTFGVARIFQPGVATYELWLKLGIVLIGARFLMQDLFHIGGMTLVLVAIELVLSLSVMTLLGRIFKLPPKLTSLLAIGSSICGVTAIMATQGAIDSSEEDTSTAMAAILTLGAIALFTFPAIGHALHMSQQSYGIWAGLAVDNTAEATVTGAIYGDTAGRFAVLSKTARSSFLGFVVLGYAVYWASKGQAAAVENKALFLWQKFPKFVLGFIAISVLATAGFFTHGQLNSLSNLSRWAFLPAFAGVGLRTNLRDLVGQGWQPLVVGILGEIFIALVTLGLVYASYHFGAIQ